MKTKAEIRKIMRERRGRQDPLQVHEISCMIQQRIMELAVWNGCRNAALYMSADGEVDTALLFDVLSSAGRTIAVPAADDNANYRWARFSGDVEWVAGPYGIRQPGNPQWIDLAGPTVVVVPGLAFDHKGNRLGHGKGIYDRLLARLPQAVFAAAAFEWQVVRRINVGENDIAMDWVVTEKKTMTCSSRARGFNGWL